MKDLDLKLWVVMIVALAIGAAAAWRKEPPPARSTPAELKAATSKPAKVKLTLPWSRIHALTAEQELAIAGIQQRGANERKAIDARERDRCVELLDERQKVELKGTDLLGSSCLSRTTHFTSWIRAQIFADVSGVDRPKSLDARVAIAAKRPETSLCPANGS